MSIIAVSYAHNPEHPGAGFQGTHEHEMSAYWTDQLIRELNDLKIPCLLSLSPKLREKVRLINKTNSALAVEIHFNGCIYPHVKGCETLYHPGSTQGKLLAESVHNRYAHVMENPNRGIKEGWYKMDRPGVRDYKGDIEGDERPDYFLAKTNCPAIILEPDFISQQDNLLDKMEDACKAIAAGIHTYLEIREN